MGIFGDHFSHELMNVAIVQYFQDALSSVQNYVGTISCDNTPGEGRHFVKSVNYSLFIWIFYNYSKHQ